MSVVFIAEKIRKDEAVAILSYSGRKKARQGIHRSNLYQEKMPYREGGRRALPDHNGLEPGDKGEIEYYGSEGSNYGARKWLFKWRLE